MSAAFNVPKLREAALRKGLKRKDIAIGTGVSLVTLVKVFKGAHVSDATWLRVAGFIESQPDVTDTELLEAS